MNKIQTLVSTWIVAWALALTWCWKKSDQEVTMVETAQKCESILFWLAQNCVTNAEVKWIKLTWTSNYSIAWKAWKENDTWSVKSTNVPNNIEVAVKTIEESIREQVDKSSLIRTDVKVNRKSINLTWNAVWKASYVWNMESGKYTPWFWALDSATSTKSIEENKINATARCNDTINSIWNNIAPNLINQVNCKWEVIPFSNEELNILLSVWGWLLEYKEEYRGKNISPAIIAFSYIKLLESWKIQNDINDAIFKSNLDKAISIVKSKHYVNIDWVKANILLEINKNEVSKLWLWIWLLSVLSLWIWLFRNRRKNR